MAARLQQLAKHLAADPAPAPHPFDPLSAAEIERAVAIAREQHGPLSFNAVTVAEPRKDSMLRWLADAGAARPPREVEVVAFGEKGRVFDGVVDLGLAKVVRWEALEGVQPLITMEELQETERYVRADLKVVEQCRLLGITDMSKVYCDAWTIGHDARWSADLRLQQALMYYRPNINDNQYAFPLDFCPIINSTTKEIIHIDIPQTRRPVNTIPSNYFPADIPRYRDDLKPLRITQPEGVSFTLNNRELAWSNFKLHIGFNYREGLVLNNIRYTDAGVDRPLFYRLALSEMVVPYGNPEHPHQRKHAFDLGEYGAGYMTNHLRLNCDCAGAIHYLPATLSTRSGRALTIPRAICIHEEDTGLLFKHSDFRDGSVIATRGRRLVISHVFTAANYEYGVYYSLHLDGTITLDIKLTGILNTYSLAPHEPAAPWGTAVHPGVNAHNHQHLFCLRIDPHLDGRRNTIVRRDAIPAPPSPANPHGNAFLAQQTVLRTVRGSLAHGHPARVWDITNPARTHPFSGEHVAYRLVSRDTPRLLARADGLVGRRAGFARYALAVTPYVDGQLYAAGRHVPQSSGVPARGLPEWVEGAAGERGVEDTDVVLWHTFGLTHFPAPEDFPVMPAETVGVALRPRHFFTRNPALDVRPSYVVTPEEVRARGGVAGLEGAGEGGGAVKGSREVGVEEVKGCCGK